VDDKKALAEIYRVLKPGGVALIMLPVIEGWAGTYENPKVTTPEERKRHYGQADHVRYYGADVRGRIRAAGFQLEEFTAEGEDVLEETPDFLQETPEHDRLWFEQKPPRDFDFDK